MSGRAAESSRTGLDWGWGQTERDEGERRLGGSENDLQPAHVVRGRPLQAAGTNTRMHLVHGSRHTIYISLSNGRADRVSSKQPATEPRGRGSGLGDVVAGK